jgi:hypothetical protein
MRILTEILWKSLPDAELMSWRNQYYLNRKRSREADVANANISKTATNLKHLRGYKDTATGGLSWGDDDHVIVEHPENVFIVDHAIESVQDGASPCTACEANDCTENAIYGAKHPRAKPKRCAAHRGKKDIPVICGHPGCTVQYPLVCRTDASTDHPSTPAVCIWHALMSMREDPGTYTAVRATNTCFCGKQAFFGIDKTRMVCGACAESISRHLGTALQCINAGNCGRCAKRRGDDHVTPINGGTRVRVCRPCYKDIVKDGTVSGFRPEKRHNGCDHPGCDRNGLLRKDDDGTLSCKDHATGDGYSHRFRPCRGVNCRRAAYYAAAYNAKPVACRDHATEGVEFNVVQPRCRVCLATQLVWHEATIVGKKNDRCRSCQRDGDGLVRHRFYEKTIVKGIVAKLTDAGLQFQDVRDRRIDMLASEREYRPDLVLRFENKTIFIEVDEMQHAAYDNWCERVREAGILSSKVDIDAEKLFIRVNPDAGGKEFALFTTKPTADDLMTKGAASFTTPRFDEKINEIVELCRSFMNGDICPGHVYYVNWTSHAPPRDVTDVLAVSEHAVRTAIHTPAGLDNACGNK